MVSSFENECAIIRIKFHKFININHLKLKVMGNLLYVIAVILIIGWLLGVFAFHVGSGLIHILLVIAIIAIILRVIQGKKIV